MSSSRAAVDTARAASLSFAPPEPTAQPTIAILPAARPPVPFVVRPGRYVPTPVPGSGGLLGEMSEYPIQVEKVQAPPLRDDILSRDRLLDWLNVKIHNRVVLLTAEAGYGKTTLLADFARRTRLRVLWYRLDRGDRDWVGFIAYLVAAVRAHLPAFGPATASLLREVGSSAPPLQSVLDTFLRELAELGSEPTALVFDDFHLVDDSEEVRHVVSDLLSRAPERLAFVFASRRVPPLRLARLRTLGEVGELTTPDLRFDGTETERFFLEDASGGLDPSLVAEVARRTEGWPASLQLVRTAIRERDPRSARSFVESLSGADGDLYDYLAEEVVGDLNAELQDFLMRTSILEKLDIELAAAASGREIADVTRLVEEGRRHGLLGRVARDSHSVARAHPLVRQFLERRLLRSVGPGEFEELHRCVAIAAEGGDWRQAAQHYAGAGDHGSVLRVIESSLPRILGNGAFHLANEILELSPTDMRTSAAALVISARMAQQSGNAAAAIGLAERAMAVNPDSAAAITTLMAARSFAGDVAGGIEIGRRLEQTSDATSRALARAYRLPLESSVEGSISEALEALEAVRIDPAHAANLRYAGVTRANEALLLKATGDARRALDAANDAIGLLSDTSADLDQVSARLARAWALAHLGDIHEARLEAKAASAIAPVGQQVEVASEVAELEYYYGDPGRARSALDSVGPLVGDGADQAVLIRALLDADELGADPVLADLSTLPRGVLRTTVAFEARRQLTVALVSWMGGRSEAIELARRAAEFARRQGATLWQLYGECIVAAIGPEPDPSRQLLRLARRDAALLSMASEAIVPRLGDLSFAALSAIAAEANVRPERWRPILRGHLKSERGRSRVASATLLASIGQPEDVAVLAGLGRTPRDPTLLELSKRLARRVAPLVEVLDLGRVRIRIGDRTVDGSQIRRKVLALLCLLLTRPRFSASREDVTENLWPDLDPGDALNSLNQTVYFLRRVIEPGFREDMSAGYVHQDGELVWLDPELIKSQSSSCRQLISSLGPHPSISDATSLLEIYEAPFALDFAYEEWAVRYRDPLHAAVLRVAEQALRDATDASQFGLGVGLAERALVLEPEADEIQVALIHLYTMTGAHAAAAEHQHRYTTSLQSLGIAAEDAT